MKRFKFLIAKGLKRILFPSALRNCQIDKNSYVCAQSDLNNVSMGKFSYIGYRCFATNVKIGNFCSIADNCRLGNGMHPIEFVSTSPVFCEGKNILKKNFSNHKYENNKMTIIENDVWIGANVLVKSGVTIHNGAVVGMGSVVTKDIPAYEIWAGVPARFIRRRFETEIVDGLENLQWWNWDEKKIMDNSNFFDNPSNLIRNVKEL